MNVFAVFKALKLQFSFQLHKRSRWYRFFLLFVPFNSRSFPFEVSNDIDRFLGALPTLNNFSRAADQKATLLTAKTRSSHCDWFKSSPFFGKTATQTQPRETLQNYEWMSDEGRGSGRCLCSMFILLCRYVFFFVCRTFTCRFACFGVCVSGNFFINEITSV